MSPNDRPEASGDSPHREVNDFLADCGMWLAVGVLTAIGVWLLLGEIWM